MNQATRIRFVYVRKHCKSLLECIFKALGEREGKGVTCYAFRIFAVHCFELFCLALLGIAWHCFALHCFALRCIALFCFALHCCALLRIASHCFALLCFSLHGFVLLCCSLLCIVFCQSNGFATLDSLIKPKAF